MGILDEEKVHEEQGLQYNREKINIVFLQKEILFSIETSIGATFILELLSFSLGDSRRCNVAHIG